MRVNKLFQAACLASVLFVQNSNAVNSQDPVVDVGYARYRGNLTLPHAVAYLGIPYAEPPLGDGRWRAPSPLNTTRVQQEAAGKIVDATQYADFCIQGTTGCTFASSSHSSGLPISCNQPSW